MLLNGEAGYISTRSGELVVLDIADRRNPRVAGVWDLGEGVWSMSRDGNKLWTKTAGDQTYIKLFSLEHPLTPELVWSYQMPLDAMFCANGDMAIGRSLVEAPENMGSSETTNIFNFDDIRNPVILRSIVESPGSRQFGPAVLHGTTLYGSNWSAYIGLAYRFKMWRIQIHCFEPN